LVELHRVVNTIKPRWQQNDGSSTTGAYHTTAESPQSTQQLLDISAALVYAAKQHQPVVQPTSEYFWSSRDGFVAIWPLL